MPLFADVILPLALADSYTYEIPKELENSIQPGHRVIVPFGRNKFYTAIVFKVHQNRPENISLKEIHSQLDSNPIVNQHQLKLWQWISFYYMAPMGDVYNAALPTQLKLESKAYVSLSSKYHEINAHLTPTEQEIVDYLQDHKRPQQISNIARDLNNRNIQSHINALSGKKMVLVSQTINPRYTERRENYIRIHPAFDQETAQDVLRRAKKQLELYNFLKGYFEEHNATSISRKELLLDGAFTASILSALINKDIVEQFEVSASRLNKEILQTDKAKELTPIQQEAYDEVKEVFEEKDV
ncbi:MAG: hypothetical protein GX921_08580, partial [Bacteroidales bacterium]|nr:hypothetical protein [Bacteroidales bacterium]